MGQQSCCTEYVAMFNHNIDWTFDISSKNITNSFFNLLVVFLLHTHFIYICNRNLIQGYLQHMNICSQYNSVAATNSDALYITRILICQRFKRLMPSACLADQKKQ